MAQFWHIPPEWRDQTAIIICGGTSVTPDMISMVREAHAKGEVKVIVINSTYLSVPWADMLFFADERWWKREREERPRKLEDFQGFIVTTSLAAKGGHLLRLRKVTPTVEHGLVTDRRDAVALQRTSLQGALNICHHKHVSRIILLGADNRDGPDGRAHFHEEYPWDRRKSTWSVKINQLQWSVLPLRRAGIEVYNASPISTLPWWPKRNLEFLI